jgi:hypothetical protein
VATSMNLPQPGYPDEARAAVTAGNFSFKVLAAEACCYSDPPDRFVIGMPYPLAMFGRVTSFGRHVRRHLAGAGPVIDPAFPNVLVLDLPEPEAYTPSQWQPLRRLPDELAVALEWVCRAERGWANWLRRLF